MKTIEPGEPTVQEARTLLELINTLSLFTRRTMLEWMPELISEMGITGERFMVMFELDLQADISLKQLAGSMMVSPSSMSVMINGMVEQGTVSRFPDSSDRRKVVLRLSEKGKEELDLARGRLLEKYREFLKSLTIDDRQELSDSSRALLEVVDRILERP